MLLVTTPIEETWSKKEEIVFLGKWCTLYTRKKVWEQLNHSLLGYHWNDRSKLLNDFQYIDEVYEKYLGVLSSGLNEIHDVSKNKEYWRIVIGPWLRYFINIIFDRYRSLMDAKNNYEISNTIILNTRIKDWTPLDFKEFHSVFTTDLYNHYLYGEIIKETNSFPYQIIESNDTHCLFNSIPDTKKTLKQKLILKAFSLVPNTQKKILFLNSGFSNRDAFSLLKSFKQWPKEVDWYERLTDKKKDNNKRNVLKIIGAESAFEELLEKLIRNQIPYAYIENYNMILENTRRITLKPKIMFTISGIRYNDDDCYKVWAAENKEKGAMFILGQHGGNFGSALFCDSESHQIKISDNYYSWGWKKEDDQTVLPLPSAKLQSAKQQIKSKDDGDFAWLLNETGRYAYRLASFPIASQWEDYFSDQRSFLQACSTKVKNKLVLRPHPKAEHSGSAIDRIFSDDEKVQIVSKGTSMYEQLNNSSISICTFNTTAHLETMAANFPTLIFWNPNHWEIRPEAEKVHEELNKVGILWYSPQEAANHLNNIFDDIQQWWTSEEVQTARLQFVNSHALTLENTTDAYHDVIKDLIQ